MPKYDWWAQLFDLHDIRVTYKSDIYIAISDSAISQTTFNWSVILRLLIKQIDLNILIGCLETLCNILDGFRI